MENIVSSILEIEEKAEAKLEAARNKKKMILASAKLEEERLVNEKLSEIDAEISALENTAKSNYELKLAEFESVKNAEFESLKNSYESKHLKWEEEIFSAILNG